MNKESNFLTVRGLERRLKKYCVGKTQLFLAVTNPGFESIVSTEIVTLENTRIKEQFPGGVEFYALFETVYDANINMRCVNRILMRICSFKARSYPELYNKAKKIRWELYSGFLSEISFSVSSRKSRLHHTDNISKTVFDAMKEYMYSLGVTTSYKDSAPICFYIRFYDDICTISIDSSGELLYKRGYRMNTAYAPIRETIASSILLASKWEQYPCIADPLCGSGTFLLEAAMCALSLAPGKNRSFAFQSWPSFNVKQWNRYQKKSNAQFIGSTAIKLYGSDIDQSAISASTENARRLGVGKYISFSAGDCLQFNESGELGCTGLIVSNLPYGKRIGVTGCSIEDFFSKFGRHLNRTCKGWDFAFVTAHELFEKLSGLSVSRKIRFSNGGINVMVCIGHV